MRHALEGSHVGLMGKVKGYKKPDVKARVIEKGGTFATASNPKAGVDLYLLGMNPSEWKCHMAMALGIPMLSGDAVITLLEQGGVEWDEDADKHSFDELIGQARALLDRAFSREVWLDLCGLVDTCQSNDVEKMVSYLEPQLAERATRYMQGATPYDFETGELQPFPDVWMGEVMNGAESPKFILCKSFTYLCFFVGSTLAARVFDQPGCAHMTVFDTGEVNESDYKKKSFYKKMSKAKNLGHVHTLILGFDRDQAVLELLEAKSLPAVTSLYLRKDMRLFRSPDRGAELFFGPWSDQLVVVGASCPDHLRALGARIDELPALEELVWGGAGLELESLSSRLSALLSKVSRVVFDSWTRGQLMQSGELDAFLALCEAHSCAVLSRARMSHT